MIIQNIAGSIELSVTDLNEHSCSAIAVRSLKVVPMSPRTGYKRANRKRRRPLFPTDLEPVEHRVGDTPTQSTVRAINRFDIGE
ncbi:hypothetical protein V9K92_01160 [Phyllobacterium sp. CCNWLW109]